jgi:C4-dicarboxylate-specific signal transduction histidine kinase
VSTLAESGRARSRQGAKGGVRIQRDVARAGDVIRGLRALAKKSGPQLTKLDIDDVIREALTLTAGDLRRHDVVLHTELAAGDRPVLGDRVQLQQVLLNLIMNGVQAMSGLTERARELTVSSTFTKPNEVLVAVEDTGTGLDPAVSQRIFEPFFTTKPEGLGMGLYGRSTGRYGEGFRTPASGAGRGEAR